MVFEVVQEGVRILFLLSVPLIAAVLLVGVIVGVVQAATTVREEVISYVARVSAAAAVIYFLFPYAWSSLKHLAELAFTGRI